MEHALVWKRVALRGELAKALKPSSTCARSLFKCDFTFVLQRFRRQVSHRSCIIAIGAATYIIMEDN